MDSIAFSVLMSVYAKEHSAHFDAALNSILVCQSCLPDELVLVCDGPLTADLDATIQKYQKQFPEILRVFPLPTNRGLGEALNYGLQHCTNEWVARADSDDICLETRFEKQLDFIRNHPETDIVGTCIDEFRFDPRSPERVKFMPVDHDAIVKMAKSRNPINHMTVMFRKSTVLNAGSYIPLPFVEDYYLWVRAISRGAKLANIGEVLVHARIGNGMESRRSNPKQISGWRTINRYMLDCGIINAFQYIWNLCAVFCFVYSPIWIKQFLYRCHLRQPAK